MDGIPASDLSDMVIEVLHSPPSPFSSISTGRPVAMRSQCERHHKFQTKSKISMSEEISLKEIDHVDPWLFDRTNLDTNIQVKYVDTKIQLADILTIGTFTRDEEAHRLQFFNLTNISFSFTAATSAI